MKHLGYSKQFTSKVVRTTHKVTFVVGLSAESLKDFLKHVPDGAKITDIGEPDHEQGTDAYIEFEDEKKAD